MPIIHKLQFTAEFYHLLKPNGPDQNYVEVERDWSDLESKVQHYLSNQDEAQRIANNVKASVSRGSAVRRDMKIVSMATIDIR